VIIYSTPTLSSNTPTIRSHVLIVGTQTADIFFSLSPYLNLSTEVTIIHHGQEALVFLQKNQVDMIIADQFLADMPGFELIQTMRRQGLSKLYTILLVSDEIYSRALSLWVRGGYVFESTKGWCFECLFVTASP
jgi:PleD family two-component response regulator